MSTISIPRGATKSYVITDVKDNSGVLIPMATAKVYFTATFGGITLTKQSANVTGGSSAQIETLGDGSFRIKFAHEDTANQVPAVGRWDAWVVLPTGEYFQVVSVKKFEVTDAVTTTFPA
jgi:hypothetical protein